MLKPLCGRPYHPFACSRWRLLCGQCLDLRYYATMINCGTSINFRGNRLAKATEHLPSRGQTIFTTVLYSISALMVISFKMEKPSIKIFLNQNKFALLPRGSPFGSPGPHGDLFQFLGPQKVPIFFPRSPFSLFQAEERAKSQSSHCLLNVDHLNTCDDKTSLNEHHASLSVKLNL